MAAASTRKLDIALAIFRLEPFGGLERHALRLAEILARRGHRVALHTTGRTERVPPILDAIALPRRGLTNHGQMAAFGRAIGEATRGRFDLVVGFQKIPGLDLLFCADRCYAAAPLPPLLAFSPRARTMRALEAACFGPASRTRIVALAENQLAAYRRFYGTPASRTTVLPPTVDRRHRRQTRPGSDERIRLRRKLGLPPDRTVCLWIGLQLKVKGLDRVLDALAGCPAAVLAICGAMPGSPGLARMLRHATGHDLRHRVVVFGEVPDETLADLFGAADLLVHPARLDVTGTVIVEALASGLPVIASAACGYAVHVSAANAGIVLREPFAPGDLDAALAAATPDRLEVWSRNALAYTAQPELFSGMERAADLIEAAAVTGAPDWAELNRR